MAQAAIRVNRAPILTLWAAVVAERLGHPPDTALSLGSAVAGTAARARARRPGATAMMNDPGTRRPEQGESVALLGAEVPVVRDPEGHLWAAEPDGAPAPASPAANYVRRAFGERLEEVRDAMWQVALSYPPEELNRIGMRLYESFRPRGAEGGTGGGKGVLDVALITRQRRTAA